VRLLIRWGINTLVILALGYLLPDSILSVGSLTAAVAVALVLGLLNTFARPVFVRLSLPLAPWTLGLFVLVVNGVVIRLFSWLIDSYKLGGFLWLVVLAVVISVLTTVVNVAVGGEETPAPAGRQQQQGRRRR
jgi:putative membrane protein